MEVVVLDLETTGLYPAFGDRIAEVGAARYANGVLVAEYESLVNPGTPISPGASRVNGLTDAMVADAPPIHEVLPVLLDFVGETTIVAHNADFDMSFLEAACIDVRCPPVTNYTVCTLLFARRAIPWLNRYSLDHLVEVLRLDVEVRHRALADVRATWELLRTLLAATGIGRDITAAELIELQYGIPDAFRSPASRRSGATASGSRGNQTWADLPSDLPKAIRQAILAGQSLTIVYEKKNGEIMQRRITPLSAYAAGPYLYVVAYCHLREEQRTFRVDRIRSVR